MTFKSRIDNPASDCQKHFCSSYSRSINRIEVELPLSTNNPICYFRVDAEQLYAKSLSKMASKLNKACREIPGSLADAWRGVATEMESRGEVHRLFSNSMVEEIVKPLKTILENQHKTRKAVS